MQLFVFLLLALQAAYWPIIFLPLVVAILAAWRTGAWKPKGEKFNRVSRGLRWTLGIPTTIFLVCYFIWAWAPEHSPDGSTYHLGFLRREVAVHGFERITSKFYSTLGQGVDLVYLPAFIMGQHSAAALTHLMFSVVLAYSMFCFGRRNGQPWVGAAAALFVFVSPVFGVVGSSAYVDNATAAIVFATFYWLEIWDREYDIREDAWRLLIPVGLMAGYAVAAKFTAFTIGVYALGFVALRTRNFKMVSLITAFALLMGGPWIVRNWVLYQNPIAPLGNSVFRNPYIHVMFEQEWRQYVSSYDVENKLELPLEVTLRGEKTGGLMGPLFLLLPLGLLALRRRTGRHIWIAALLITSTYASNIGTRFLIPAMPFFSLSIAMAIGETPILLAILMVLHSLTSWPGFVQYYAATYAWKLEFCPPRKPFLCSRIPIFAALRIVDKDTFLDTQLGAGYESARLIDKIVPKNEEVFSFDGIPIAYSSHVFRTGYESASNEIMGDILKMGRLPETQPTSMLSYRFSERTGRYFRLEKVAENAPPLQWSVHELRFFHNGVEIMRSPNWRLQAWPMPWDVQMAFDNSPVTRWRSWETPRQGMYIGVDLGREETIDEIRVETSPDCGSVHLQPQKKDASGKWENLMVQLTAISQPPPHDARRLATYELHKRGIHYILVYDQALEAPDVNGNPDAWGLVQVGRTSITTLYKSIW